MFFIIFNYLNLISSTSSTRPGSSQDPVLQWFNFLYSLLTWSDTFHTEADQLKNLFWSSFAPLRAHFYIYPHLEPFLFLYWFAFGNLRSFISLKLIFVAANAEFDCDNITAYLSRLSLCASLRGEDSWGCCDTLNRHEETRRESISCELCISYSY